MTDGEGPLHFLSLTELGARIRSGAVSSLSLAEHLLERIETLNPRLNAYRRMTRDLALETARAADLRIGAGLDPGPLHGLPYAAKDIFDVAGLPTTAGSKARPAAVPEESSTVTAKLARAGMVLLGKTITVEFAYGLTGINHHQGTPHNPWSAEHRLPGGSSAGSGVAVAAGLAPMALGSDTGGSVRVPAALCGTVGLKTTVGRISRHGVYALSWTLDSVGHLTRSVEDAALVFMALQGEDPRDSSTLGVSPLDAMAELKKGVRGLRIGIPEEPFFRELEPEVERAVREAGAVFRALGARVESIGFPEAVEADAYRGFVSGVEGCVVNGERLEHHLEEIDPIVGRRMAQFRETPAVDYLQTLRRMGELRQSMPETLRGVDLLLAPTVSAPSALYSAVEASETFRTEYTSHLMRNCYIGNSLDLCGISQPCGFTESGLPIGMMLQAQPFREDLVLRAGFAYERETDWRRRTPNLDWAAA